MVLNNRKSIFEIIRKKMQVLKKILKIIHFKMIPFTPFYTSKALSERKGLLTILELNKSRWDFLPVHYEYLVANHR